MKVKNYFLFIALLIASIYTRANTFTQANKAYNQHQYTQAIALYTQCVNQGYHDADLYYNLGNAYYKNDQIGLSILWYERALRLAPANEDIIHNLAFANEHIIDKTDTHPLLIQRWANSILHLFSANGWAVCSIIMAIFTCLCILLVLIGKSASWRMHGLILSIICGTLMIFAIMLACISNRQSLARNKIIVTAMSVVVKSTPDASGTSLFTVHEGIKATITDHTAGWIEVKFPNNEKGWIEAENAEVI